MAVRKAIVVFGEANAQGFAQTGSAGSSGDERFQFSATNFPGFGGVYIWDPYAESLGVLDTAFGGADTFYSTPTNQVISSDTVSFDTGSTVDTIILDSGSWFGRPQVGDTVYVDGSTSNDGSYTVTAVTSSTIVVSETLTNEVSTAGVSVRSSGFVTHTSYTGDFTPMLQTISSRPRINTTTVQTPTAAIGVSFGPEMSLGWNFANHLGEDVFVIKLAVNSTTATPRSAALPAIATASGWINTADVSATDRPHNDWNPNSPNKLWEILHKTYIGGTLSMPNAFDSSTYTNSVSSILSSGSGTSTITSQANSPIQAGDTLDIIGYFCVLGYSDALFEERADRFQDAMVSLKDSSRLFCGNNNFTQGAYQHIPWVMAQVYTPSTASFSGTVNAAIDSIAADDHWSATVVTSGYTTVSDNIRFNSASQITFGDDLFAAWKEANSRGQASVRIPTVEDQTPRGTLSELRSDAVLYYERNTTSNDFDTTNGSLIDKFINDAQRDIINEMGDMAWFLRRSETMSWSVGATDLVDFPEHMHRIIRIEDANKPSIQINFVLKSVVGGGKMRLQITGRGRSGTFIVHFIQKWDELTDDDAMTIIPRELQELLVLATVRRMARHGADAKLERSLMIEEARLMRQARRMMNLRERNRNRFMSNDTPIVIHTPHAHDTFITGYDRP